MRKDAAALESYFRSLCKADVQLDENILSKREFERALAGKRHCRDFDPAWSVN